VRKFALAGITVVVLGAGGAVALASPGTSEVTARAAALSTPSPRHPVGVKLAVAFGWGGLNEAQQPMLQKLDLWFPKGAKYNGARYKSCSFHVLNSVGPRGCPKGSIMGSGGGTAFADTVITHPTITVVNGGANAVYFYTVLNNPARVQTPVVGHLTRLHGQFAYHLSATIPQILQVVAGVPIKLTELHITAGRGKWLELTATPAGVKVVDTFGNGQTESTLIYLQNS
jgi:hypothetical protein